MSGRPVPQPMLVLNGWPAVGKLIATRQLISLLEPSKAGLVLNHLLINAADAVLPREPPGYQKLREELCSGILNPVACYFETFNTVYIFTEFQSDSGLGRSVLAVYHAAA
jgi:hypothetical protein